MATTEAIRSFMRLTLAGASLISLLTACPSVCPDAAYSFSVTATFSPEKDSIQVGDTLYLTSSFPTKLSAGNTNQVVDYSNAVIGSTLSFGELIANNSSPADALVNFAFITKKGKIYTDASAGPRVTKQIRYQQTGNSYELLVGFIPQKEGVYYLFLSDGFSAGKPDDGCDSAGFSTDLTNANQHLYYLTDISGIAVSPFIAKGAYCFKVY